MHHNHQLYGCILVDCYVDCVVLMLLIAPYEAEKEMLLVLTLKSNYELIVERLSTISSGDHKSAVCPPHHPPSLLTTGSKWSEHLCLREGGTKKNGSKLY